MAAVDPSHFSHLSKFFPELTELQAVHICMLVYGCISVEEIAELRSVTTDTVKESLRSAQKKLGVGSMKLLRSAVICRVLIGISIFIHRENFG
ncbi:helix-turn-helix transcriptional regulator [Pantoea ananatis]|uniref:helix-turn-helix transcriptional regulator n=1 Tax=Pantoea ananas TaxID=553 RepID=UPI00124958FB|nr:TraJ protein [Pantoea ananatis]